MTVQVTNYPGAGLDVRNLNVTTRPAQCRWFSPCI